MNKGILSRKDYTLLFENENQKKYLPVECVDTLGVYSNITFQSEVMRYFSEKKIRMVIYDRYGNHVGTFLPANMRNIYMKTVENQIRCYFAEEKRVDIARRIIIAGIHNMRSNLRYYYGRNHSSELGGIISELTDVIEAMTKAVSVAELLVIEARARQRYYHGFNGILHGEEFRFTKRTKRPPKDELDALISFGNTWIYQRIATEIYKTGLDIRFGFLHAATKRPESLNLDFAEIFKPVIVDRCIFTMINKGIIKKHHFEVAENGGIYLNREGKSLFIQTLENKLYQKIRLGNRQYTYYTVMKNDISKLILHINEEVNYKPYKHSN